MDSIEALKHIRTLVRSALEADDLEAVRKLLENMDVIAGKALAKKR